MSSVAIIFEGKNNTVLLQLRDKKAPTFPNMWGLFGGALEDNETPIEGAIRETKEELGITLNKEDFQFLSTLSYENNQFYIFKAKLSCANNLTLAEGKDMKFFSREEISKLNNIIPLLRNFGNIYWKSKD
jgi:8-oxo-dGTP diphosphatase